MPFDPVVTDIRIGSSDSNLCIPNRQGLDTLTEEKIVEVST